MRAFPWTAGVDDVVDDKARAPPRPVDAGEAQRTEIERHAPPQAAQHHVHRRFRGTIGARRLQRIIGVDRLALIEFTDGRYGRTIYERLHAASERRHQQIEATRNVDLHDASRIVGKNHRARYTAAMNDVGNLFRAQQLT